MAELKTYTDKVRVVLKEHEDARNSDMVLMARYINRFQSKFVRRDPDGNAYILLKNFKELPSSQTLVNNRKIIQNVHGEFLPTDSKVIKARGLKEKNVRDIEWREAKM